MAVLVVVSFTGTWIETDELDTAVSEYLSYPLRVRGLKQCITLLCYTCQPSYPLRVRGLKQVRNSYTQGSHRRILYGYVD